MDSPVLWILVGVALLFVIWFVAVRNRFVALRHAVKESWADIDVELKRRYDLIPNLVETVKGYAKHERELFERVTRLRNQAAGNHGSAASQAQDENALLGGVRQLFAVAEGYPQLRADAQYLALQQELANTEDRIAAARRFFNANVRDLRNLRGSFPTSMVAASMGVQDPTFFELEDQLERVVPRVQV